LPGVKSGLGVTLTPYPLLVPWSVKEQSYASTPPMESLYKGALILLRQIVFIAYYSYIYPMF
jgi:hypothetical protein